MKDIILEEKHKGKTVILTTHNMYDATDQKLNELIRANKLLSIHSSEPTLNDIFIDITGRFLQ